MVAAAGALYLVLAVTPMHTDPATIPSTAADVRDGPHAAAIDDMRRRARALLVEQNLPGLSVAVAVDGAVVWAEGFGYADVDRTPVTPLTRFRLGALSKPLTASAVALLHDRGRIDLDAPIQRYVPAYPQKKSNVTLRQLMGDVAGVHRIRGDGNDAMPTGHCASVAEAVQLLVDDPLLFEPGTQYRYSTWGWVLVSAAVEGAAGEPFDHFMIREVFEPLGMDRTLVSEIDGATPVHAPRSILGVPAGVQDAKRPDYSCLAGAGAFLSTPTDLVRLGSAMVKPGFLKADTIAAFQTPTRLVSGTPTTYALGWTVNTEQLGDEPARMVSHRGNPMGGGVSLLTFPDRGLAIAAAANLTDLNRVNAFALQVAAAFTRHEDRRGAARGLVLAPATSAERRARESAREEHE
jgi:CubicO group peptidase (beta-lactamase class C family)